MFEINCLALVEENVVVQQVMGGQRQEEERKKEEEEEEDEEEPSQGLDHLSGPSSSRDTGARRSRRKRRAAEGRRGELEKEAKGVDGGGSRAGRVGT